MHKSGKPNFLIDGFPRNKDNVDGWKKAMDDKVNIQCVLFFDCNEQVSSLPKHLSSIRERESLDVCRAMFGTRQSQWTNRWQWRKFEETVNDLEEELREKERESGFSIVTYNESTRPVIQLYEKENLVKHIDAANDVDKVKNGSFFLC